MKGIRNCILVFNILFSLMLHAQDKVDSTRMGKNYKIDEVVVTGFRNKTEAQYLPMSVSVVNQQQISQSYEESLLPLLTEQVPGLFITSRGIMGYGVSTGAAGGMSLRGLGGSPTTELLILIDGHPQYMGLMGHPIADAYQSVLAEKVEVIRGPASVLYGSNAIGGVINIITRQLKEDEVRNSVRVEYGLYNTLTAEASSLLRKGRFSSMVAVSYNQTDGHRENMAFGQYNGYVKLGYELNQAWNIIANADLSHFNASNPGPVDSPLIDNDSHVTRGMSSVSIINNYRFTSGGLMVYSNWGRHKIDDGYTVGKKPPEYLFNSKDQLSGITWNQSAALFRGNWTMIGVDYQHIGGRVWNQYPDSIQNMVNKTENEIAGYIDFRQSWGTLFTLDAGFRLDHYSPTGVEKIPQAGILFNFPCTAELKAMVGKGFRNPTIRELYMFSSQNPNLLPERILNYEISWAQQLIKKAFSYDLTFFCDRGNNLIQTAIMNGRPVNINTGIVKNWGVEVSSKYRLNSSWTFLGNYSWLRMKYPVVAAPQHKLHTEADFFHGKWNFVTSFQYVGGLYTSVTPVMKENFILWNLRGGYRLCDLIQLFVSGENLLGQSYEINAGYPMPKTTIKGGLNFNF